MYLNLRAIHQWAEWGIFMKNRKLIRRILVAVLAVDLFAIGLLSVRIMSDKIPDTMWTYVGKEEKIFSNIPAEADNDKSVEALILTGAGKATLKSKSKGNYDVDVKLFGFVKMKTVHVKVVDPISLSPSGEPIGIYVETNGLLVLSTTNVEGKDGLIYEPATNIVRNGDYILKINGESVKTIKEFNSAVQKLNGKKTVVRIRRNDEEMDVSMKPTLSKDGSYKLGMWVREDTQGIGTMTYVTKNGAFGALGHGITDADTGTLMNLSGGELFNTEILGIIRGQKGAPGELEGYINMIADNCIGRIEKNTGLGIFGRLSNDYKKQDKKEYIPVGLKQDIKKSDACIYTNIDGKKKKYAIKIEEININSRDNKGMVIRVTDPNLLKLTGGIVQGMSGSPILQDGKLIGAVTHVFVDDPTKGYGIFAETMLNQN